MTLQPDAGGEALRIHGRLALTVLDTDWARAHRRDPAALARPPAAAVHDRREGDNVMCTVGLGSIAAALVWSGLQDQAAALGVTTPTYLTPLWGAVGSGSGTVAKSDTQLFSELGRTTVGAGASSPATASINASAAWLFYFGQPPSTWTITEAGVFAQATSAAGAGMLLDHWAFSPSVSVPTADTVILQASFSVGA